MPVSRRLPLVTCFWLLASANIGNYNPAAGFSFLKPSSFQASKLPGF
jgi:hypothetical protein